MEHGNSNELAQHGFILVTVLIFLSIFSLLALTSMQTSIVELKLSHHDLAMSSSLRGVQRRSNPALPSLRGV